MRKRTILEAGRSSLQSTRYHELQESNPGITSFSEASDTAHKEARQYVEALPQEQVLHAGKVALGRTEIFYNNFSGTIADGGMSDSQDTASSLATDAQNAATDSEALAAFGKRQRAERVTTTVASTLAGVAVLGAIYELSQSPSENTTPQNPAVTSTPLEHQTGDPAGVQGITPGHERAPITTSTPVPLPTSTGLHY
jgi:hypothetical protein